MLLLCWCVLVFIQISALGSLLLAQCVDITACIHYIMRVCFLWVHRSSQLVPISKYQTRPFFIRRVIYSPILYSCRQKMSSCPLIPEKSHRWFIYALDNHPNHLNIVAALLPQSQPQPMSNVLWVMHVGRFVAAHTRRLAYPNSHICTHCCYLMPTLRMTLRGISNSYDLW